MKSSFKTNLQFGFGISLVLLVISSVASYLSIQKLLDSTKMVKHTDEVILNVENILSTLKDAETGQRGFLLTGDYKFLEPYNGSYQRAISSAEKVQQMTVDNPVQQDNIFQLKAIITNRLNRLQKLIDDKKAGKPYNSQDLDSGRAYMNDSRRLVDKMRAEEERLLSIRTEKLNTFSEYTPILIVVAAILSVVITLFF
jgi:CHASE3 domain sensor protein